MYYSPLTVLEEGNLRLDILLGSFEGRLNTLVAGFSAMKHVHLGMRAYTV